MNDNPKISVVMAAYNEEKYLRKAIESILNQTFSDFEFIIINDGSTDTTSKIIKEYISRDSRIKTKDTGNSGLTRAKNIALEMAKGDLIAMMDADDISLPDRLEKQRRFLEYNQDVGLLGSGYYRIDEQGNILYEHNPVTGSKEIHKNLIKRNIFCHSTIVVRRGVFDKVGFYNENWRTSQDYEFYFRVTKDFKLANLKIPLVCWRLSKTSISFTRQKDQLKDALRAQLNAMRERQYPFYSYLFLIRPALKLMFYNLADNQKDFSSPR
ncbi:MAG: glycosyltransferase [Candidatus Omnitrophica bacterium]|nr:glycosyltransferase [Candidatus Omnitrophota bacterium]